MEDVAAQMLSSTKREHIIPVIASLSTYGIDF